MRFHLPETPIQFMPSLNKVTLIGHLAGKPELRFSQSGTPVANFTVAVNYKGKDKEETFWGRVTCFGGWAESASNLNKGEAVMIDGRLVTDEWEKDGKKQSRTAIIANMVLCIRPDPPRRTSPQPELPTDAGGESEIPF